MYEGAHFRGNHVELHAGAMRQDRMTPFKFKARLGGGPGYRLEVERRLAHFIGSTSQDTLLFSAEGLSYLREKEELAWLRSVLPGEATIVAYLRDPEEYLKAYRYTLMKQGISAASDPDSFAYTGTDSWLINYRARLEPFRAAFGPENVIAIDFDKEAARCGSVIPSFLRVLAVDNHFSEQDWSPFFLNRRPRPSPASAPGHP